jgi:hypothetical protein
MSAYAPIQNQANINKDVSFFAPASTLGATELGVAPDLEAGFLTFGPGGAVTGSGLIPLGIIGGPGRVSTLSVVSDSANTLGALATAGVYFDVPNGTLTGCSLIYKNTGAGQEGQINVASRNIITTDFETSELRISTLNGIPYDPTPGVAQFRVQAGTGETVGSNSAIITLAIPYASASTLSITATPTNIVDTTFHSLTLSDISQSSFVVTTDTTGVTFDWITNGSLT